MPVFPRSGVQGRIKSLERGGHLAEKKLKSKKKKKKKKKVTTIIASYYILLFFYYYLFIYFLFSRGNQHPLPPPLALDVEVLDKKIGLRLKGAI